MTDKQAGLCTYKAPVIVRFGSYDITIEFGSKDISLKKDILILQIYKQHSCDFKFLYIK